MIMSLSVNDGMDMQYLIECQSYIYCNYIIDDGASGLNRTAFAIFVSDQMNSDKYFEVIYATNDALLFNIESIRWRTDAPTIDPSTEPSSSPTFDMISWPNSTIQIVK